MAEDDDKSRERPGEPGEDEKTRRDRELIELLNELRVVLPGVQVLFAFLLTVPFSNGYTRMTELERDMYFVTFLATALATILLIAPSTYHRLLFRRGDKERMLYTANRMTIAGTMWLAVAMASAVFVITDVLFGAAWGASVAAAGALTLAWFWYVLPLRRRLAEPPPPEG
ncbi:MAG: DUF6328 family protein [Actinomycetota bacterium]